MRRSQAPSLRTVGINLPSSHQQIKNLSDANSKLPEHETIRSTNNVLNLLLSGPASIDEDNENEELSLSLDPELSEGSKPNLPVDLDGEQPENLQPRKTLDHSENSVLKVYNVVYGKQSKKKHKTWEGDGTLEIGPKFSTLKDETGKVLGTVPSSKNKELEEGSRLFVGTKEVELVDLVNKPAQSSTKRGPSPIKEAVKKVKREHSFGKKFAVPRLNNISGLVLPEPNAQHQWYFNKDNLPVTPVCVEGNLANKLRHHQQLGVTFLYECIMGFKENNLTGAILADEMGLGKTLQCIALVWTLLKQGPYGNRPVLKKVLIVTPSSLTMNWHNEFIKWLGREKLVPFVVDQKTKPSAMTRQSVMIISYEMFVRYYEEVEIHHFDLLICDEGHRLKNSNIRTTQLLNSLNCDRRILLTGTPIQNDLQEYFALVDFVNPNALGSAAEFRRHIEEPILASRQPNACEEVRWKGEECAADLNRKTGLFLLRRTREILGQYLPAKHEVVVFCKPAELQMQVYNAVIDDLISSKENLYGLSDGAAHLGVIATLKKICNHPALVKKKDSPDLDWPEQDSLSPHITNIFSNLDAMTSIENSSKMTLVVNFLRELRESSPKERVVLVSNSTQTLDMFGDVLSQLGHTTCRLDGSTPAAQRSEIVDRFNRSNMNIFVFLLSSKAGGVGLNLTGASRLILYDSDWNPATDLQAMSRIWRDGQKHSVYIYRLLTCGTIEEKIYQRQISKQGLCDGIIDPQTARSIKMSKEELKAIFTPCEILTDCWTHDALSCDCDKRGKVPVMEEVEERDCQLMKHSNSLLKMSELFHWEHHGAPFDSALITDLKLVSCQNILNFIFRNCTV